MYLVIEEQISIIIVEAPIAFPPCFLSLIAELFAVVLTNEWMRIEMPKIVRIFWSEKSCPS